MYKERPSWLVSGERIQGLRHRMLDVNTDRRGTFTEIFCDAWDEDIRPRQWSVVRSKAGVLRGMHLHLEHEEYISVLSGRACVGLYDLRPESTTRGAHAMIELNGETPACVTFPRGVLHGWYFYEPSIHLQAISNVFQEYGARDNWGCNFDDPRLSIPWPNPDPILSDRARNFPSLETLERILAELRTAKAAGRSAPPELMRYADTAVTNTRG